MSEMIDWRYMTTDTRARVYLLWAYLAPAGFVATHYHQQKNINGLWFLIILIGLGYMAKVMKLSIPKLRNIFLAWAVPLTIGLAVSILAFWIDSWLSLTGYLGGFWLLVMAAGYFLNGLVDAPSTWYWLAVLLNLAAGLSIFIFKDLVPAQYLLAAIITAWSMLNLWLFRVD